MKNKLVVKVEVGRKMILNSWPVLFALHEISTARSEREGPFRCNLLLPKKCVLDVIGFMV